MIEKWKALGTQEKLIVMAVAIFLTDAFLGWRFFLSQDLKIIRLGASRIQTSQKKKIVFSQIAATEVQLKKYDAFLSESTELEWLIEAVNRLIAGTGLVLISAAPQPLREGMDYHRITLSVEAAGGYHNLGKFVEKIENDSPFIKIASMQVDRNQGNVGQTSLRATLILTAYYPVGGKKG